MRERLFWRIYMYGALLLVVVAAGVCTAAFATRGYSPWHETPSRLASVLERELGDDLDRPEALKPHLDEMSYLLHVNLALYRPDHTLALSAGDEVLPGLDADGYADLRASGSCRLHGPFRLGLPIGDGGAYMVVRWKGHKDLRRGLAMLLALLGALALGAFPIARAVVRPLERVTETARRLGEGDLAARSGLARRDEIGVLGRTVDEMAERLQQLVAHEKELVANVSHELRTPLARIRVAVELAADDPESAPGQLMGIEQDLLELDALIEDVITTARLDLGEGGYTLRRSPVAVGPLLDDAARRFRERHPQTALEVEIGADLPEIEGDAALLGRVVRNLLANARTHGAPPIELTAAAHDGGVLVEVADRGPGVEHPDRVFNPFFRGDLSRTRVTGGVGLGLTLCQRIVTAHGGEISARSRVGGGAVFRIELNVEGVS
jgi:signal transduction histidine kinase